MVKIKLGGFTVKKNTYEHMNDNIEIYDNPLLPILRVTHRVKWENGRNIKYLEITVLSNNLVEFKELKNNAT